MKVFFKHWHIDLNFKSHRGIETFGHVTSRQLNLASLINIEKCAEAIKAEEERIDLLVLNAGE